MLKSLPKTSLIKQKKEIVPSNEIVNAIFNYSKSLTTMSVKNKKTLIHLN